MVRRMGRQGEVLILVHKILGLCEAENGTSWSKWAQTNTERCKNEFMFWKTARFPPQRQEIGRLKDRGGGLPRKNTEDCCMISKRWDSWHRQVYGISPERNVAGRMLVKKETVSESTRLCIKKIT